MKLQALRGATTCTKNSSDAIEKAVFELVTELLTRNQLNTNQIISITFSATKDLDACFPASIARKGFILDNVALLDCQQMYVKNDLEKCIRILAYVWLPEEQSPIHTYLGNANSLRPDL